MSIPVALTIAGSDSGGGAGIQADLKTFHAFGVFGTSAITAVTAQNTLGVRAVHVVPADVVRQQIDAVVSDFDVAAVKTSMLATREIVEAVAQAIRAARIDHYVLDPVMVATSGDRLLDDDAVHAITRQLLPLAALVTPNLDEARVLTGMSVDDVEQMKDAARRLHDAGARAVLLKGGHLRNARVVDVLYHGGEFKLFDRPRIDTNHTHGTGCTLSAAIAAGLATGRSLTDAVSDGIAFVHDAIRSAPGLGRGHGPLNHFTPRSSSEPRS